jgi:hypothetical protein
VIVIDLGKRGARDAHHLRIMLGQKQERGVRDFQRNAGLEDEKAPKQQEKQETE